MATSLSKKQCDDIMKPIRSAALSALGNNRHLSLVVVHGPQLYQGMGIPHLWTVQGILKLWIALQHSDAPIITGHQLRASMELHTLEIRLPGNLLQHLRNTLAEMGHPQPPTPVQVDNSTTNRFANKQIKQQRSKSMDMRFYWIQDCVAQKQFNVTGAPDQQTLLTTSSSIILRHIIDGNDQHTYIVSIIFHHFCKGVLIQIHSRAEGSEPNDRSRANQQYWPMPMLINLVTSMIY
jgi:hypothetical protein